MLLMNNRVTLRTAPSSSAAALHALGTSHSLLRRPLSHTHQRRRPLHVVHFKEGDKMEEEQPIDQLATPPTTEPRQDDSSATGLHAGHRDPIKRSRDALNQLLGRSSSTNSSITSSSSSSSANASTTSSRQHRPSTTPAFEAPLNTPVYQQEARGVCVVCFVCAMA